MVLTAQGPESAVEHMYLLGFSAQEIDCLPVGVSVALKEAVDYCRRKPKSGWDSALYSLIEREDYAEQQFGERGVVNTSLNKPTKKERKDAKDLTGVEIEDNEIQSLRFREDDRLEVVQRIMSCKQEPSLNAKVTADSTEETIRTEQQSVLLSLSHKLLSLPLARSLLTFETSPIHRLPEQIQFPHLTVSAKLPPLQEPIHLDPTTTTPQDYYDWPNFHNGVSTGLTLPHKNLHINNSWILQNNPAAATCAHGGLLFALGLQGHLRGLEQWQLMLYLQPQHLCTTVGALLGVAASFRGTSDVFATRVLSVHVPRLLSGGCGGGGGGVGGVVVQFSNGGIAHSAAVLGLGLVYMGTARRRFVEVLVDEVGGRVSGSDSMDSMDIAGNSGGANERIKNLEGHCVASGIALGMVLLGKGESVKNLEGVHLVERLSGYLSGKGSASGIGGFGKQHHRVLQQQKGSGEMSAAGAAIALGLIYLKTGSRIIADKLQVPSTSHLLDYVRSDLLLVRVFARNLILWDSIQPSSEWVESQVPQYIRDAVPKFDDDDGKLESLKHARYHVLASASLSLAIKFAGSLDSGVKQVLMKMVLFFQREAAIPAITFREKLNKSVVRSCNDVVTLCLGVVMAGSGDVEILRHLHKCTDKISPEISYGSHMALQMSIGLLFLGGGSGLTLGTSNEAVAALVCALYPRFPISADDNCCHLQALRHMWVLAVERRRCLVTRDVDSREACVVPVIVRKKGERHDMKMVTPCILPLLEDVDYIEVDSERYLSVKLEVGRNEGHLKRFLEKQCLFVKRKTGHLDYIKDPKGQMGILSRSFPAPTNKPFPSTEKSTPTRSAAIASVNEHEDFLDFILTSFSKDPKILAFAQELCSSEVFSRTSDLGVPGFALRVLRECLVEDKADAISLYFELYMIVKNAGTLMDANVVYDLEIVDSFYSGVSGFRMDGKQTATSQFSVCGLPEMSNFRIHG
ncbi:UNVERIFIED_CONTAM: Anaphase-promoting complex subunit 1 [Siphonaria sp. JEL0065]|nr:Anaphase-promoting complex subunit 1 [Siphonaria sp. JEL0065]